MNAKVKKGQWIVKLEKLKQCNNCNLLFVNPISYKRHIKDAHPNKPNLEISSDKAVSTGKIIPRKCIKYDKLKDVDYKKIVDENGRKKFQCYRCPKAYRIVQSVIQHVYLVHRDKELKCEKCSKTFALKSILLKHFEKCDGSSCRTKFKDENHKDKDAKNAEKMFQCDICSKTFSCSLYLKRHYMIKHVKEGDMVKNSYKCETCGKVCLDNWKLNKHIITHEFTLFKTDEKNIFQCKKCGEKFESKMHFYQHFYKVHLNKDLITFKCVICEKICTDNWKLKMHLKSHETFKKKKRCNGETYQIKASEGKKLLQCNHCEKSFEKYYTFRMHNYIHHKEKNLKCDRCRKKFSIPSLLKVHEKKCVGSANTKKLNQDNCKAKLFTEDFVDSNLDHNDVLKSIPCKKELDTSENVTTQINELIANSKLNEVKLDIKTECISTSIKSEFVKQE